MNEIYINVSCNYAQYSHTNAYPQNPERQQSYKQFKIK